MRLPDLFVLALVNVALWWAIQPPPPCGYAERPHAECRIVTPSPADTVDNDQ